MKISELYAVRARAADAIVALIRDDTSDGMRERILERERLYISDADALAHSCTAIGDRDIAEAAELIGAAIANDAVTPLTRASLLQAAQVIERELQGIRN